MTSNDHIVSSSWKRDRTLPIARRCSTPFAGRRRDCGVGTMLISRGPTVVVLADTERPWEAFRSTVERELRGGRCRVGVGSRCNRVADLPRSHEEALLALRVQALAGGPDQATAFDELGVYRLFAGLDDLTRSSVSRRVGSASSSNTTPRRMRRNSSPPSVSTSTVAATTTPPRTRCPCTAAP